MTDRDDIGVRELEFRRRWHRAHIARFNAVNDSTRVSWREERLTPHAADARQLLNTLGRTRDLSSFQAETDRWVRSFDSGYGGTGGQMIINQINKMSPDPDAAVSVLVDVLSPPQDLDDAVRKIRLLADHLQEIRVGAHPSPKRAPFVASYYWALDNPQTWPAAWPKSAEYMNYLTGNAEFNDQGERYAELYRCATEIDGDPRRFEQVAAWWADERPVLLDDVLCDRAALREGAKDRGDAPESYRANAAALVSVAKHFGTTLETSVSEAAGRTLKTRTPGVMWDADWPRGDLWTDWRVPGTYGLSVRVWLNAKGLAIGLRPFPDAETGAAERAVELAESHPLAGYELLAGRSRVGRNAGFTGGGTGEVIYARWFDRSTFPALDLRSEVLQTARDVAPIMSELNGENMTQNEEDDALAAVVAEFKSTTGYPTPGHDQDRADRRDFAKLLDPEELSIVDRADLRPIWNTQRYGGTGPMSILNKSVRDADDAEYQRIIDTFTYVCWGDEPPATRINRALEDDELRVKGFGESVMMKMLAITHPEQFITVYPYTGPKGKLRMLKLLGLDTPDEAGRGQLQVASNDALRARLDSYFPGDPLGMGAFLYWYAENDEVPDDEPIVDPLDDLAEELLVERAFLDDVVALLEDKKQVVFYGPPGTGKTYFARKLAETLVPEASRRPIVQFHPSTSYEDFFEGYRPETDVDGVMTYRLQRGPLAELAARANDKPGHRHLMIIDEINRANLPKVLGELLFLLEYRDTPVRTLYRPDDPFELSKDIWFIGTMNTADRSIALIDAALRRRFHFIPFFPNHGPMAGLLGRWLQREGEPAWVGEVVAQVNDELDRELGGPHLQLGPSHFMKRGLDKEALQRIWVYDIEPFIEDQFFGDATRITYFRFDQVWKRFNDLAGESISENLGEDEPDLG
ncbi:MULTISPECIES: McrB family protein [unclassified Gordonia (in: high G+C Gram-positive bacteria)]|uniref:McrB family protein n=1 Tax=unclassified Gordonia (in: high G+C Gram-positive bacteria) TaxID=2657482 RepID=UPI001CF9C1BC|nr:MULTISPECIES: AAA family ATPase [unclassified Gordonia (in: high G+C Gram-positive bacteria)]MCT1355723.1 AAA family ATPase [Gordonia sp. p3-SID1431]UCZ90715.1 AAA family ATPase [Gordonia sp. WA4-43]